MTSFDQEIIFRFDGLEAKQHRIELYSLGESLQGLSRIFAASANFSNTYKVTHRRTPDDIIIYAKETKANCFTVTAVLDFLQQQQILSGSINAMISLISGYIFLKNANRDKEEINARLIEIEKVIRKSGVADDTVLANIIGKIKKMPASYRAAAQRAVAPLGQSASELKIATADGTYEMNININDAIQIRRMADEIITESRKLDIYISELDKQRKTAKIYITGEDPNTRFSTHIYDQRILAKRNPYKSAFESDERLVVQGRLLIKSGRIKKVFIHSTEN